MFNVIFVARWKKCWWSRYYTATASIAIDSKFTNGRYQNQYRRLCERKLNTRFRHFFSSKQKFGVMQSNISLLIDSHIASGAQIYWFPNSLFFKFTIAVLIKIYCCRINKIHFNNFKFLAKIIISFKCMNIFFLLSVEILQNSTWKSTTWTLVNGCTTNCGEPICSPQKVWYSSEKSSKVNKIRCIIIDCVFDSMQNDIEICSALKTIHYFRWLTTAHRSVIAQLQASTFQWN